MTSVECHICHECFDSPNVLMEHRALIHNNNRGVTSAPASTAPGKMIINDFKRLEVPKTQRCSKCGVVKWLDEFNKNRSTKSGYQDWCRECLHTIYRKTGPNQHNSKSFICSHCGRSFLNSQHLNGHMNAHAMWTCPKCGEVMQQNSIKSHLKICGVCSESGETTNASAESTDAAAHTAPIPAQRTPWCNGRYDEQILRDLGEFAIDFSTWDEVLNALRTIVRTRLPRPPTYEDVMQVFREEKRSNTITEIRKDFYITARQSIRWLERDHEREHALDPQSDKTRGLKQLINRTTEKMMQIFDFRAEKVTLMAIRAASGGKLDESRLTPEEKALLESVLQRTKASREAIRN